MRVNVICRNWEADRVLPRFARYLADGLGWTLTAKPVPADAHYLMGYFETQVCPTWPAGPVASLFTHREEADESKARLYDQIAQRVQLRVAMCRLYAGPLAELGPTIQPPLPVERDRFVIAARPRRARPVVGFSGYTYKTHRKGEDLTNGVVNSPVGRRVDWVASGRGWPVKMRGYTWKDMPGFYQGLDVLVCPSRVEGGPMPVLEALSCGVRVVVPRGVGILDELPDAHGIYRYRKGDVTSMQVALDAAAFLTRAVDRDVLRTVTEPYTVAAWCAGHAAGLARVLEVAA